MYAEREKSSAGGRLNNRREGKGRGVDGEEESMMKEKWGASCTSLAALAASVTSNLHTSAA